jgi:hypothetical protein
MRGPECQQPPSVSEVWPNVADRDGTSRAMASASSATRPEQAVIYFSGAVPGWLDHGDLDDPLDDEEYTATERMAALITAVTRDRKLVKIDLEATDNAQRIFETLNGRGECLPKRPQYTDLPESPGSMCINAPPVRRIGH